MTSITNKTQNALKCNRCGSKLILLSEKTQKVDNYASLITTRIYKCSNKQCQDEIDKATKDRKKLQKQQEVAKQNRITAKHNLRLNKRKILR